MVKLACDHCQPPSTGVWQDPSANELHDSIPRSTFWGGGLRGMNWMIRVWRRILRANSSSRNFFGHLRLRCNSSLGSVELWSPDIVSNIWGWVGSARMNLGKPSRQEKERYGLGNSIHRGREDEMTR